MSITEHSLRSSITQKIDLPYLLYTPDSVNPCPLIIYLHGSGERGTNPDVLHQYGPNTYLVGEADFPFVVASPQCPQDSRWTMEITALETLLKHLLGSMNIDPTRVYLTGNSMGGYGTWCWAATHPQHVTAIAPICGGGSPWMRRTLTHTPIWAFHGDADKIVELGESQRMVNWINAEGGHAELTVYPGVDHDSWSQTYLNPQLYAWFLQYQKR